MTAHSSLVGGSTAKRRILCPASFQESLKAPRGLTSVYAEHGTACHDAMAHWLRNPDDDPTGKTFNDHVITSEDTDSLLTPAWDALVELQEAYGGGFKVTHLEKQVQFPGIPGAYGTCDVILQSPTHFVIVDFKFGAGVYVPVKYSDGELNAQLLFYLTGAWALAGDRTLVIAIIQPTFEPHLSHAVVTPTQLNDYGETLHQAVALALSDQPPRARSEECRFAPCKATCSLWTGALLDLSALGRPTPTRPPAPDWGAFLAAAKRLVDSALMYQKEIDQALMDHLKAGGSAPGFAVKPQVKNRKWLEDTAKVAKVLKKLGFPDAAIWQEPKLQTFKVADSVAKKLNVDIPDALRPTPPSTDFVLTYEGDPAAVDMKIKTAAFSAALKRLANQT